jgi:hypothetical protein
VEVGPDSAGIEADEDVNALRQADARGRNPRAEDNYNQ